MGGLLDGFVNGRMNEWVDELMSVWIDAYIGRMNEWIGG